jgi:hypothetical protein
MLFHGYCVVYIISCLIDVKLLCLYIFCGMLHTLRASYIDAYWMVTIYTFYWTCCLQPGVVLVVLLCPVWPAACSTCQPMDTVPACFRLSAGLWWQSCSYCDQRNAVVLMWHHILLDISCLYFELFNNLQIYLNVICVTLLFFQYILLGTNWPHLADAQVLSYALSTDAVRSAVLSSMSKDAVYTPVSMQ